MIHHLHDLVFCLHGRDININIHGLTTIFDSVMIVSWSGAGHAVTFAVWCFLIIFGNVMEARQMMSIELDCDDETREDGECVVYSADSKCCVTDGGSAHQNAFKVLSVVGGTVAAAHLALFVDKGIYYVFSRVGGVLYVFHRLIKGTGFVLAFVGLAYVYQHLTYFVFFCHHNPQSCAHPPTDHWVISRLFYSLLALSAPYLAVQVGRLTALALVFAYKRERALRDIMKLERDLRVFEVDTDCTFSEQVVDKYRDVQKFMRSWMDRNDEDVSEALEQKATHIVQFFTNHNDGDGEPAKNARVSFETFRMALLQQGKGSLDGVHIQGLWNMLVKYDDVYREEGDAPYLSHRGLQDMLYDIFFRRKELIHSIYTDHYAITFLARVAICFLYPATFIAISRIFGYQNAFGTGVDLFKIYVLSASYLLGGFRDNVMFMLSMLTDRPFNIGDVLLLDGETYKVRRFSITHFYLDGPHHVSVPIPRFVSGNTINLSKRGITDSLRIAVPLNASPDKIDRDRMFAIMHDYQKMNERDVSRSSIRCGWAAVEDGHKVMQCNWRYNFRIFDRSRLNWARADFRQYVIQRLEADLGSAYLDVHIAGGGGFNDLASTA